MKKSLLALSLCILAFSCSPKKETTVLMSNENITNLSSFITNEQAFEGKVSYKVGEENEYGPTWRATEEELQLNNNKEIEFQFRAKMETAEDGFTFVLSSESKNSERKFNTSFLQNPDVATNEWRLFSVKFEIEKEVPEDTKYVIYFWNNKKKLFYIDNIEMITK